MSFGDGFGPVPQHVSRVAELGMNAVALTEHGNSSSWVQLEKACRATPSVTGEPIKPIFGIEAYIANPGVRQKNHMILLAMNQNGLQNINRLITESWVNFYQFPTIYLKNLAKYNEGIIALSGCADSQLACVLLGGKSYGEKSLVANETAIQRAGRGIQWFKEIFGDRYYIEVQRFPGLDRTCALNPLLAQLSQDKGVELCATADVHYPYPTDNAMQRILHASHRGMDIEVADAGWEYDILLTYPESDKQIFKDLVRTGLSPDEARSAIKNTSVIADRCNVELTKAPMPRYQQGKDDWNTW